MDALQKFELLYERYAKTMNENVRRALLQNGSGKITSIEALIEEELPHEIRTLYEKYDGESENGLGSFAGHSFMSLKEIEDSLLFSRSLVKPSDPTVANAESSDEILRSLVNVCSEAVPKKGSFKPSEETWYKLMFECSPNSIGGPYFYPDKGTNDKDRTILKLSTENKRAVYELARQLHQLEKEGYNWDTLDFTVFGTGEYTVQRQYFDFDSQLNLSCRPENSMRLKYFHVKWLPLIHDGGGNYIGVDLDPGQQGVKGQIIVFGRDEEDMFVVSRSWEDFLDLLILKLDEKAASFREHQHLHDFLKRELYA